MGWQADSQLLSVCGNIHQQAGILLLIESFCVAFAFRACHTKRVTEHMMFQGKCLALLLANLATLIGSTSELLLDIFLESISQCH